MVATDPPVSVLISVLNSASWLREVIDNVLAQTFADLERTVVDTAPQDATPTSPAAACYRLAALRLRERAPMAVSALVLRGLATAPVATLRRALS